jgi:uncharacterized protein YlxP (DUF503 family)
MVVGMLRIEMHLSEAGSLKEKRKVVKSLIGKVRSRFNAAVAEVGSNDKWQLLELGVTTVGNDRRHIDSSLNNILTFVDSLYLAEIINTDMEIISV